MATEPLPPGNKEKKFKQRVVQSAGSNAPKKAESNKEDEHESDFMTASMVKSAALHLVILLALVVSFNFSSKPLEFVAQAQSPAAQPVEIVQATFIDSNVIEQKKREKAQAEAAAAAKQRKQEAIRKQEQERERKRRAEDARKKREQEAQKEKQRIEAEQERLNALERERQKEQEIAAQREQQLQQERMQQQLAQEMAEELEREQAAMQAVRNQQVMSELEKYQSLITQTIMRNLTSDGGFKGKKCKLNVKLASNGLVLEVKALEGNGALCRAAQTAVLRPSTLPVSSDPEVFQKMKNLNIIVEL